MDEERKWYRAERIENPLTGAEFDEQYDLDYNWPGFCGWGGMRNALANADLLELSAATRSRTMRIRVVERSGDKSTDGRTHKGNRKTTIYEAEFNRGTKRVVRPLTTGR